MKLGAITSGEGLGSGVRHGDALSRLVNVTLTGDGASVSEARKAVVDALGVPGLVDAAGVIATFTMQNRVADAAGLPLDAPIELATRELRVELGAEKYGAAALTSRGGWFSAALSRVAGRLAPTVVRLGGGKKKQG